MNQYYPGTKLCNVFEGSSGYMEWVWIEYRLPIQHRRVGGHRGIHQITVSQKKQIEINIEFKVN